MKKNRTPILEPFLLKGTKDYLPEESSQRKKVISVLENVFEQFGYTMIETPSLVPKEILIARYGKQNERLIYHFLDKGNREVALAYDMTVPFSRYIASNFHRLPMPFKRYQTGKVWRAEKPQHGKLREFMQCDIDIIGSKNLLCEAEIIKVIDTVLKMLSVKQVEIKINSRKLLNEILIDFGIKDDQAKESLKIVNKINVLGQRETKKQLKALGCQEVERFIETVMPKKTTKEYLERFSKYSALLDIKRFLRLSSSLGVNEKAFTIDPSFLLGLDYYTGIIFRFEKNKEKPICTGGRYDDLCGRFCDEDFSGVGASFNIDKLVKAVFAENKDHSIPIFADVLIAHLSDSPKEEEAVIRIFNELIRSRIKTEIYFDHVPLAKQFKYAEKKNIPFVVICGEKEISESKIKIKRMNGKKQKKLLESQLVSYLKGYYDSSLHSEFLYHENK